MAIGVTSALAFIGAALADGGLLTQLIGAGASTAVTYVLSFVIALGVLIFIHELGHFVVAKALGVGVERFSLGFGPRLWSLRRGETEYCVSVIPLGGYVKMVGEEAYGEEAIHPATETPRDVRANPARSFALKPLWARTLIVLAGPAMNFVLAAAIFSGIFAVVGVYVVPPTVGRILKDSPAAEAGLMPRDEIVAVDGQPVQYWAQIQELVERARGRPLRLTVVRNGERREVIVTPRKMSARTAFGEPTEAWSIGASPYIPPTVGDIRPGMPAAEAGLKPGDRILAIDGEPIETWDEMSDIISKRAGEPVVLTVERGGQRFQVSLVPQEVREPGPLGNEVKVGRIGIGQSISRNRVRLDPVTALARGIERTWEMAGLILVTLWKLVTRVVPASIVGGPLQIGMVLGQAAQEGMVTYLLWLAGISVNLAVLNLLPVPMLDGGHLLFFAIEAVLGRPMSVRKREIAQQVGLALLLVLIVFATANDIPKVFSGFRQLFK